MTTVNQLIEKLQALPSEAKEMEVVVKIENDFFVCNTNPTIEIDDSIEADEGARVVCIFNLD